MLTRVHHVGLVVRSLDEGLAFWRDTLGLAVSASRTVEDQGVKAALLPIGRSEIELLEPINANGGVAKFLEKRGEGLHHVCFETPDVGAELAAARERGFPLIDQAPRQGLAGMICFLHPKGTRGVLVEFATPPPGSDHHGPTGRGATAGLALAEIESRSRDAADAARLFATKLGLEATGGYSRPGIATAAVVSGGVRLVFVSPEAGAATADARALAEAVDSGGEGLAGLLLEVDDVAAARGALGDYGATSHAGGFRLASDRCHGVPLGFRAARRGS